MEAPAARARIVVKNCMVIDVCLGSVGMLGFCDNAMLLRVDMERRVRARRFGEQYL
jgi:hypothetical protein